MKKFRRLVDFNELPRILTPEQASTYLQIPLQQIMAGLKSGELPGTKIAGEWRISSSELQRLFEGIPSRHSNSNIENHQNPYRAEDEYLFTSPPLRKSDPSANRILGVVKMLKEEQDYGFIATRKGKWVYFKKSEVRKRGKGNQSINVGDQVEFTLQHTDIGSGLAARDVVIVARNTNANVPPPKPKPNKKSNKSTSDDFYKAALMEKERKNIEKARMFFEKAIDLEGNFDAFLAYASMENKLKHTDKALQILEKGLRACPNIGLIYERYALILEKDRRDLSGAISLAEQGLEKTIPKFEKSLHWTLARILMKIGDDASLSKATIHAEKAKELGLPLNNDNNYRKLQALTHPMIRKARNLLREAGFEFSEKVVSKHDYTDLFASPANSEYAENYALNDRMIVRCFFRRVIGQDINEFLEALQSPPYSDFNISDIGFLVIDDLSNCYNILEQVKEGKTEAIIPLDSEVLNQSDPEVMLLSLQQIFDQWLARRDLFDFRFPVKGRRFFGRSQEILNLMRHIDDGHSVGVYGLRKVGKTSLLYQIKEKRSHDIVVYIDLQESISKDCSYLYWKIANELQTVVNQKIPEFCIPHKVKLKLGSIQYFSEITRPQKNALYFEEDLSYLVRLFADHEITQNSKIIIVLDELELMLPIRDRKGFEGYADFFRYLRGVSQATQGKIVNVIAAANPTISEQARWENADNPMFHFYKEMFLPLLENEDCCTMLKTLGQGTSVFFDDESIACIYSETGGHPAIARQFCSYITRNKSRPFHVDRNIVLEALDSFIIDESNFFGEILERLDADFPLEKNILLKIANGITKEYELSSHVDSSIDIALRHLIGYQIVEFREGEFKIKINLFNRWIRRFHLGLAN